MRVGLRACVPPVLPEQAGPAVLLRRWAEFEGSIMCSVVRARVSCVLGIVVQLRCFLVLFGASLCIWSAVENIENIVSPDGGFARSRERMEAVRACMLQTRTSQSR